VDTDPFLSGRRVSWAAAVAAGASAVVSVMWLQTGSTSPTGFDGRMGHIAADPGLWVAGWVIRSLAVVLVLAAFVALSRSLTPGYPVLRTVGLHLVAIGVAAEIVSAAVSSAVLPALAVRVGEGEAGLRGATVALEAAVAAASGVVCSGLLATGGALLTHAAFRTPPFPRSLALVSLPVWGAGFAAAGGTLAGSATGSDLYAYLFLPLFAFWIATVATIHFRPPAGRS
jgi:hypothetical protein